MSNDHEKPLWHDKMETNLVSSSDPGIAFGADIEVRLTREGVLHAHDRPAAIQYNLDHPDEPVLQKWYEHGQLHREGGRPAWIESEKVAEEIGFYEHGQLHRTGGPAHFAYRKFSNIVTEETWCIRGKCHRIGGPACVERSIPSDVFSYNDPAGYGACVNTSEEWWHHDKLHRIDGPAITKRDEETGFAVSQKWYQHHKLHRDDGPAVVERDPQTGEITNQQYFVNGVEQTGLSPQHSTGAPSLDFGG